jgi:hypothetical protein
MMMVVRAVEHPTADRCGLDLALPRSRRPVVDGEQELLLDAIRVALNLTQLALRMSSATVFETMALELIDVRTESCDEQRAVINTQVDGYFVGRHLLRMPGEVVAVEYRSADRGGLPGLAELVVEDCSTTLSERLSKRVSVTCRVSHTERVSDRIPCHPGATCPPNGFANSLLHRD